MKSVSSMVFFKLFTKQHVKMGCAMGKMARRVSKIGCTMGKTIKNAPPGAKIRYRTYGRPLKKHSV